MAAEPDTGDIKPTVKSMCKNIDDIVHAINKGGCVDRNSGGSCLTAKYVIGSIHSFRNRLFKIDNGIRKLEHVDQAKAIAYGEDIVAEVKKFVPRMCDQYKDAVFNPFDPKVIEIFFIKEYCEAIDSHLAVFGNSNAELIQDGEYDNKKAWSKVRVTITKLMNIFCERFAEALKKRVGAIVTSKDYQYKKTNHK